MKTITLTIKENTLRRIDAIVGRTGRFGANRSQFIRDAICNQLARIEKEEEEKREREIFKRSRSKLRRQALVLIKEQTKR
ncbi:MAG: hypothetical protein DMG14_00840 [Acidobacteria bacterium]|nr:MAG: hypothetical protein DMG14_00840 [Acidobacteriota bacterium]